MRCGKTALGCGGARFSVLLWPSGHGRPARAEARTGTLKRAPHRYRGLLAAVAIACVSSAADFSGERALEYTRHAVAFGSRPAGSGANHRLQAYIEAQIRPLDCRVIEDAFTAQTPDGPVAMKNIIALFPGSSGRALVVTGHYDTKKLPGFVGANDGGSSAGFLLELAQVASTRKWRDDLYIVWLDGEEAFHDWSADDSVYGSRHLAARWEKEGTLARVKALINVDMIGDKDLDILRDANSSSALVQLVWKSARDLGYDKYFLTDPGSIDDDHMPFIQRGANAIDIIDFDYGPNNSFWHTPQDTMDKLSAHSFQVVGDVLVEALARLQ